MGKNKKYLVNIDMKWSQEYSIKAGSASEAKKKAWEKFKNKLPKNSFEILSDQQSNI